jgi:predicted DNA-binding protein
MKNKKEKNFETVTFRLTEQQLEKLKQIAEKENRTLSNYIRTKIFFNGKC